MPPDARQQALQYLRRAVLLPSAYRTLPHFLQVAFCGQRPGATSPLTITCCLRAHNCRSFSATATRWCALTCGSCGTWTCRWVWAGCGFVRCWWPVVLMFTPAGSGLQSVRGCHPAQSLPYSSLTCASAPVPAVQGAPRLRLLFAAKHNVAEYLPASRYTTAGRPLRLHTLLRQQPRHGGLPLLEAGAG